MAIPKWLETAVSFIGTHEMAGPGADPAIAAWLASVGLPGDDEIPNCAAFVNYCLGAGGVHGTGKANAKSYLEWGVSCGPRIGAVAVMNRGDDPAKGHVAFVLDYQPEYNFVYLIGANQNDRVGIALKYTDRVLDFRYPAEAES
jgi:uncharacterized protein (TIGR02594 family)